jgi:hypothetical protein
MASVPSSINPVTVPGANLRPTGGADPGVGFHSEQPISIERHDPTENTHFKNRLEEQQGDIRAEAVATYPKYPESPFVRYVSRPLSQGALSKSVQTFAPEDRSHMGVPLNPFWIRNDLWSMKYEADIFADSGPNWVAPQVSGSVAQNLPGYDRTAYLDNQEQPQHSSQSAPIKSSEPVAPSQPAAGSVTSTTVASQQGEMPIQESNPAVTNEQNPPTSPRNDSNKDDIKVGDSVSVDVGPPSPKKSAKKPRSRKKNN